MIRAILFLAVVAMIPASVSAEEAKPATKNALTFVFGDRFAIPANTGFVTSISPDKQAATVVFDDAVVSVGSPRVGTRSVENQTAIQTKSITLNIPFSSEQEDLTLSLDVRGFHDSGEGATTRLIVCAGDTTKVVSLLANEKKVVKMKGNLKEALVATEPDLQSGDFQDRIIFKAPKRAAKPVIQVTLVLIAEQDTDAADSGGALLVVDSLDFGPAN